MKKSNAFLSAILLTLVVTSMLNPTEATSSDTTPIASFTPSELQFQQAKVSVIVESKHDVTDEEVQLLDGLGTVTTIAGQVAVLQTHMADLATLERLPFVSRIERSHPLHVLLDKSVPDIGADIVWSQVKDTYGRNVTGAGIVIGFVDTGIDTTHPDFSFPNGTTKILYVWDQTTPGRPPSGFGYGYECTSDDIQARECPEVDSFGHGTHVAGIAASSGRATGNYTGVAPGAAIIFVKSGHELCNGSSWTFDSSQILDGINYIVKKAAQLGKRAVINLSLGGNIGAHDGTDPMELGLDAFVKAGTPMVVAAGNSAQDKAHARGNTPSGRNVTLNIAVKETTVDLQVDLWYSPQDQFSATLTAPDGRIYKVPTPPGGTNSSYGNVTTLASSSDHGRELYFEVNSTTSLSGQSWNVTLTANQVNSGGFWDAWVDTSGCSFPGAIFTPGEGYDIDSSDTIGIPGTARYVVTVGAYVTKTAWKGLNGQTFGRTDIPSGGIAPFSSLGPTRDGRIKPDVVAPGVLIVSARSNATSRSDSNPDTFHRVLAGTSMAAPHVAGVIALILQYAPNLQATELPTILRETARLDEHTGFLGGGSTIWGFGKVDARTATGLFRLTLVADGIPKSVNLSVHVDGEETFQITGGSWFDLYFLKGTTHTVTLDTQLQGGTGTRYELKDGQLTVTSSLLKVLNYTVYYLLTVNSQYGTATGSGWYKANTTAMADAPRRVSAPGVLGYIGAEYVLVYWVTEEGKVVSDPVRMDQPKSLTAVYVVTYPVQTGAVAAILAALVVMSVIVLAKRRKSRVGLSTTSS